MGFVDFFKNLFKRTPKTTPAPIEPFFTGIIDDPRTPEEKQQDWLHEERVFPEAADPYGNAKITVSPYPYLNQNQTSSCVPHAVATALAIERVRDAGGSFVIPAPIYTYRQRANYPQAGTYPPEAFALMKNQGIPPAFALPTPQTEAEANAVMITAEEQAEAAPYKGKAYFSLETPNDIDAMAHVTAQGHAMPICIFATYAEYAQPYPTIINPDLVPANALVRHEVCILPNSAFIQNGVKYVTIQDSAWFGGFKLRYLTESFVRLRVTNAGYWDSVQIQAGGPRPKYTFTHPLSVGAKGEEVRQMQLLLISEGLLPTDCATGNFGGLTLAGVRLFQNKYADDILSPQGLSAPTRSWGPGCIKKANELVNTP